MILRLVYALFNEAPRRLTKIPFGIVRLSIDDGSILEAKRILDEEHNSNKVEIRLLAADQIPLTYLPDGVMSAADIDFPVEIIENMVPRLDQIGPDEWLDQGTGQLLGLDEVLATFGDQLPNPGPRSKAIPDWLTNIRARDQRALD